MPTSRFAVSFIIEKNPIRWFDICHIFIVVCLRFDQFFLLILKDLVKGRPNHEKNFERTADKYKYIKQ